MEYRGRYHWIILHEEGRHDGRNTGGDIVEHFYMKEDNMMNGIQGAISLNNFAWRRTTWWTECRGWYHWIILHEGGQHDGQNTWIIHNTLNNFTWWNTGGIIVDKFIMKEDTMMDGIHGAISLNNFTWWTECKGLYRSRRLPSYDSCSGWLPLRASWLRSSACTERYLPIGEANAKQGQGRTTYLSSGQASQAIEKVFQD